MRLPYASHRGQRIHYTVAGAGPLVVLQHGLLLDAASWTHTGLIDALSEAFQVVCIDSLGHGLSDTPSDVALYDQEQRAGDFIAVLDDLGEHRAHVIGHSMGGWTAVGIAKYFPDRLSSLTIGGWGLVDGLPPGLHGPVTFESFMKFAKATAPELAAWVTTENQPGVHACFNALGQLAGAADAVLSAGCPVMLWNGRGDAFHDPMQRFAAANDLRFLSTAGDHLGMLFAHGVESGRGLRAFLDSV